MKIYKSEIVVVYVCYSKETSSAVNYFLPLHTCELASATLMVLTTRDAMRKLILCLWSEMFPQHY
jgi:hypothetical protein